MQRTLFRLNLLHPPKRKDSLHLALVIILEAVSTAILWHLFTLFFPNPDPLEPVVSCASVSTEDFESLSQLISTYKNSQLQKLTKPKSNVSQ